MVRRRIGCLVVAAGLVGACTRDAVTTPSGASAPTAPTAASTSVRPSSSTLPPAASAPPTSVATTTTTTTIITTTTPETTPPATASPTTAAPADLPTDPDVLAGMRVLCAFEGTAPPDALVELVRTGRAAGVLLFAANLASPAEAAASSAALQAAAAQSPSGLPAIVAVDQEGGRVARVPGPPSGSAAELGLLPAEQIRQEGADTAANLRTWGINVDLAPVADVARAGTFLDVQNRSFSGNADVAAAAVTAFVTGLHDGDVAATLKHFPGLGAADANTDHATASVDVDADTWRALDALPFAAGVEAGADLVMMSSAVYPSFDSVPALLSPTVVDQLLRHDLGFQGVVISDALGTPALTPFGTLTETALAAASAGVDLFISNDADACVDVQQVLADAIRSGALPIDAAQASYRRVATLRSRLP